LPLYRGRILCYSCFWWPFIVLLLVSFLFLLTKLTIFLLYLLSCFFHKLPSRKLFSCGNTRFGSSLFTSFMLAGVLLQVALLGNSVLSMSQSSCGSWSGNFASLFILVCVSLFVSIIGYVLIHVHIWLFSSSVTFSAISLHHRFNVFVSSRSKDRYCRFTRFVL